MFRHNARDLAEGWEFKVLHSAGGAFRKASTLQRCLAEESQAGWSLVEKLSDYSVRLKRPADAKKRDGALGIDAYRTTVGMSEGQRYVLGTVGVLAAIGSLVGIVAQFKG
jgi:hypothetical protein